MASFLSVVSSVEPRGGGGGEGGSVDGTEIEEGGEEEIVFLYSSPSINPSLFTARGSERRKNEGIITLLPS
jgi:hypothetical protein